MCWIVSGYVIRMCWHLSANLFNSSFDTCSKWFFLLLLWLTRKIQGIGLIKNAIYYFAYVHFHSLVSISTDWITSIAHLAHTHTFNIYHSDSFKCKGKTNLTNYVFVEQDMTVLCFLLRLTVIIDILRCNCKWNVQMGILKYVALNNVFHLISEEDEKKKNSKPVAFLWSSLEIWFFF